MNVGILRQPKWYLSGTQYLPGGNPNKHPYRSWMDVSIIVQWLSTLHHYMGGDVKDQGVGLVPDRDMESILFRSIS